MQQRVTYHILFWIAYLLFKTYLNFISSTWPDKDLIPPDVFVKMLEVQAIYLLIKIPMVYVLFAVAERYLNKKMSAIKSGIWIILLFSSSTFIFLVLNHYLVVAKIYKLKQESFAAALSFTSILYTLFLLLFIAGVALAIKLVRITIRQKEANQEMMKKKLETELQFLKSQTNPHFLFNTLNNIYALARKKSDDTADVVMKLSKLLRFMLYESQKLSIPVSTELAMITDYIKLEELRYNDRLTVSYKQSIDDPSRPIAPLLLLPFLENAFKHGTSETRFNSFININVTLKNSELLFIIENSIAEIPDTQLNHNIGLSNVSRQLELMYPEHSLEIDKGANRFMVTLTINLHSYAAV